MRLARLAAAGIEGVDGYVVQVEVSRREPVAGLGRTTVVGLPDAAVRESIERITPALVSAGVRLPGADQVVVNLAPADRRKEGPAFDLAIALGLAATIDGAGVAEPPDDTLFLAELALDGRLRPVRGVLPAVVAARAAGLRRVVVAAANAAEAAVVDGIAVFAPADLRACLTWLAGGTLPAVPPTPPAAPTGNGGSCLSDVRGQEHAKRALVIAAAGGHNLLMLGPPGSGKTMLARRLPGLLPAMTREEALDASRVHSVSGLLPGGGLLPERPFRAPHHNVSAVGLIGGGSVPRPGEVSLAHNGVLFLDELPEFPRTVLETLRQPLEDGHLTISRAGGRLRFPAQITLVAAMNPCPCGYLGHPTRRCTDSADATHRYRARISGPLLDRIDIHLEVPAQRPDILIGQTAANGETTADARTRVQAARERMLTRQGTANARLDARSLRTHLAAESDALALLTQAMEELGLSARAGDRICKVARTIADLDNRATVGIDDIAEAVGYRVLDRPSG